jgi:hypothetical protein
MDIMSEIVKAVSQSVKSLWEECCVFVRSKQKQNEQNNILQCTVLKNVTQLCYYCTMHDQIAHDTLQRIISITISSN